MTTFLNVGTNQIIPELFSPIQNNNVKPIGGLWATRHNIENIYFNEWIDYLSINAYILLYKRQYKNPFNIPATFITLKNNAKIFIVANEIELEFLLKDYDDGNAWIDFEALSKDYDGIFISIRQLHNSKFYQQLKKFAVDTLILFNVNCIQYYQKAEIEIAPFDIYHPYFIDYEIKINDTKEFIPDPKYNQDISKIMQLFSNYTYLPIIDNQLSEILNSLANKLSIEYEYNKENESIQKLLTRKLFNK